jgi:hypothetical protein
MDMNRPDSSKASPLPSPEERLKQWQRFKGIWQNRIPDPVEELEKMCKEWDRELSPVRRQGLCFQGAQGRKRAPGYAGSSPGAFSIRALKVWSRSSLSAPQNPALENW